MTAEKTKNILPPYVPYSTFSSFINGLNKSGIPSHIDKSIMSTMSGSGQSAMIAALKSLRLIDSDFVPSEDLEKIVISNEDDYSTTMNSLIKVTYAFLFDESMQIENTTSKRVEEKFRNQGVSGSTLTKCISFFLAAAKDANIQVSSHVKAPKLQRKPVSKIKNGTVDESPIEKEHNKNEAPPNECNMEKITIPLPGMDDGYVLFPADMSNEQSKLAVKMTRFILDNFYGIEES